METKRITAAFAEKALTGGWTADSIECALNNIEEIFMECNEELSAVGTSEVSYDFQPEEISRVAENMTKLQIYVGSAHPQVYEELDFPLYKDFKNHATETLSQIILSDLSTDNTFGMEEHYKVGGRGEIYNVKRVKEKITMEDFLGIKEITEETGVPVLENVETIGEFATLFRADYDKMKGEDVNVRIEAYMTAGEYDHKAYHPGKDFLSGLLDITIIKPLIEYGTGSDLITGESLTETEKSWKMAGVCIDFFTVGQGAMAIKGAGLTGKQVVKTIGKTAAVELMSNAAGYTVSYGCDELEMPLAVTWMLSVFTGCTVSASAGKYILKDANGLVKEISSEEAEDFLKKLASAEDVLEGGTYANPNKIDSLLDGRPELTGSTREKLLATVQDLELSKIVNELYRPGATVGDGGTAAILVEEFSKGSSTHLLKATERLKQLKKLASSGKLGLNDLDVVEALIDDLESAISLYN